jgi:hypothetical protein
MDSLDEGIRWMMKGRGDSSQVFFRIRLVTCVKEKYHQNSLLKVLVQFTTSVITLKDDSEGNEISLHMFVAHRLTMEALPSCWFSAEPQNELSVQFSSDLEERLKGNSYRTSG